MPFCRVCKLASSFHQLRVILEEMEAWITRKEKKISKRKSDILSDIMPMYHISKICGSLPVRFALARTGRYVGQVDCAQVCYGIMLLLALAGLQGYGVYLDGCDGLDSSARLSSTSLIIVIVCVAGAIGAAAVVILGAPCRWRFIQRALDKLVHVDEKLGAPAAASASNLRKLSVGVVSGSLAFSICTATFEFFSRGLSSNDEDSNMYGDKGPLNYAPLYLMYLVVLACQLQYAVVVFNVGERFRKLNHVIGNLGVESLDNRLRRQNATRDSKPRALRSALFDLDGQQYRSNEAAAGDEAQQAEAIDRLITLYDVLCDSIDCVNKAYGVTVLTVALNCLVDLTITDYYLYLYIFSPDPNTWPLRIVQSLWTLAHIIRMLIMVQPCHMVAVEAQRTGALVNQASTMNWSPKVKVQLRIFSMRLLHRPVEFSACGLFHLNRSMLTSFIGTVATYLVILVQFQTPSETEDAEDLVEKTSEMIRNVTSFEQLLPSIK